MSYVSPPVVKPALPCLTQFQYQAFIAALTKYPQQSYMQLLNTVRDELKGKYQQKPQLSASHPMVRRATGGQGARHRLMLTRDRTATSSSLLETVARGAREDRCGAVLTDGSRDGSWQAGKQMYMSISRFAGPDCVRYTYTIMRTRDIRHRLVDFLLPTTRKRCYVDHPEAAR